MKNIFYIEPYVHITLLDNAFSLYNTISGDIIECQDVELVNVISHLVEANKNTYLLLNDELTQDNFKDFIKDVQIKFIGDIYSVKNGNMPLHNELNPKIEKDINEIKENDVKQYLDIKNYLTEIEIFMNSGNDNFLYLKEGYKQLDYPISNYSDYFLDADTIINIIKESNYMGAGKVNIIVSDLERCQDIKEVISYLKTIKIKSTFYIHFMDFEMNKNKIENIIDENINIILLVDSVFYIEKIKEMILSYSNEVTFSFIIQDEKDYDLIENNLHLNDNSFQYEIKPFFNGNNINFFKENVFIEKEDILANNISHKELKINEQYNSINFGKMYFLNDGTVYTNLNLKEIGNIKHNTIEELLTEAIINPDSGWRKTRNKVDNCECCIYNCLCPPISNYEYVIGRFNLCNIVD